MKFARLTRINWAVPYYKSATVWINFDHVAGMSNASDAEGGGAYLKFLLQDTSTGGPQVGPNDAICGPVSVVVGSNDSVLFIPLTRFVPEAGWSNTVWLNLTHGASCSRDAANTKTRIRAPVAIQVATVNPNNFPQPQINTMQGLAEIEVVETPQQIADLARTAMKVVTVQVKETVEEILQLIA